jgi:CubicO group peptidase (beta-lactamase class C family)
VVVGLLELAESLLRSKVDDVAGRYVRSTRNVGLAVGLLDDRTPDGHTVFEIGSVTKVFTAALLAEMAGRGEVEIDQPVAEMLPSGARMPCRRGEPITLAHLAEHPSALPRLPGDLWAAMGLYSLPGREEALKLDLSEELKKGGHYYDIPAISE